MLENMIYGTQNCVANTAQYKDAFGVNEPASALQNKGHSEMGAFTKSRVYFSKTLKSSHYNNIRQNFVLLWLL